jgi:hypothetical protein
MRTVALLALLAAGPVRASNHLIAIEEVLGSWQGDDGVQFVELHLLAAGQNHLSAGGELVFDDASGSAATRRVFTFTRDVLRGEAGARVLVATTALGAVSGGVPADFTLPAGALAPRSGRVCYRVVTQPGEPGVVVDCVAYGLFTGDNGPFGKPTPVTPDNRSLVRVGLTGTNRADWRGVLEPTPQGNSGAGAELPTLCGDGLLSQGEECDGTLLDGETCATLGFASGTLACDQCHFDTSRCSFCGNDAINPGEECDGTDLGGRTCAALGFTGGALACTERCRLSTRECDPTFFVPGGGPRGPECLAEWRMTNAGQRPGRTGKAAVRQRCTDGDAGCDADTVTGTCTFTVAVCLDRNDARLASGGRECRRVPIAGWTLLAPPEGAPDLLAAVAALGASAVDGNAVTFAPPLDATERCTAPVAVAVPTRGARPGRLRLRTQTAGEGGRPVDRDALVLVCAP